MGKLLSLMLLLFILIVQIASAAQVAPKITVSGVKASDTEVRIDWKTNMQTTSVITVLDQVRKLENLKSFSTTLQGLQPGTKYEFDITACDAGINCANFKGDFTTSLEKKALPAQKASGITGAVIGADTIKEVKSIAIVVFYGLLAVVVLGVVARIGYGAVSMMSNPAEKQMKNAINNAEGLITSGKKDEAFQHYNSARTLYSQMSPSQQAKYYDRLIATYSALQQHKNAKEAGRLADRYIAGSITKDELERLRELLI